MNVDWNCAHAILDSVLFLKLKWRVLDAREWRSRIPGNDYVLLIPAVDVPS